MAVVNGCKGQKNFLAKNKKYVQLVPLWICKNGYCRPFRICGVVSNISEQKSIPIDRSFKANFLIQSAITSLHYEHGSLGKLTHQQSKHAEMEKSWKRKEVPCIRKTLKEATACGNKGGGYRPLFQISNDRDASIECPSSLCQGDFGVGRLF